jgi:hypothetical protein
VSLSVCSVVTTSFCSDSYSFICSLVALSYSIDCCSLSPCFLSAEMLSIAL